MSSTATETFTPEPVTIQTGAVESIRPEPMAGHFARMAGLYAWILVTLAIFMIAAMLSGIQKSQTATEVDLHSVDGVSASHPLTQ